MCSLNEEEYVNDELPKHKDIAELTVSKICKKCSNDDACVILRAKDAYCEACFLAGSTHKFRATLGKSKLVRPTDSVLVAHSGEGGSTALLHLVKAGAHESVHKRLVFRTSVLYIDGNVSSEAMAGVVEEAVSTALIHNRYICLFDSDGAVDGQTIEQRRSTARAIANQIRDLGLTGYIMSLDGLSGETEPNIYEADSYEVSAENSEVTNKISDPSLNLMSREDLRRQLRQRLLVTAARKLGCNKVFLADDSTDLAVKVLGNISSGRGAHLSSDVGFVDARYSDVMLCRPMRAFSKQEIAYYLDFQKVTVVRTASESTTERNANASIRRATEKFVAELDSDFPGTVSTIFRTGEKLGSVRNAGELNDGEICALCSLPLDTTNDSEITALRMTAFSRLLSTQGPNGNFDDSSNVASKSSNAKSSEESECHEGHCCSAGDGLKICPSDIDECLCYGCRLIFKDRQALSVIPRFMLDEVRRRTALKNMHKAIGDFLL